MADARVGGRPETAADEGLSNLDVSALAHLGNRIRPEWGKAGIAAALHKVRHRDVADVLAALLNVCRNRRLRTPGVLADEYGSHWPDQADSRAVGQPETLCEVHQQAAGRCTGCAADRLAGTPPPTIRPPVTAERRQEFVAEIRALIQVARERHATFDPDTGFRD